LSWPLGARWGRRLLSAIGHAGEAIVARDNLCGCRDERSDALPMPSRPGIVIVDRYLAHNGVAIHDPASDMHLRQVRPMGRAWFGPQRDLDGVDGQARRCTGACVRLVPFGVAQPP
jgi:hypothetical protein